MALKPNALRMQAAVDYVAANPGATMVATTAHVLETMEQKSRPSAWKQAASVVDRVIKDRLVLQAGSQRLFPWDAKRKTYAEALERAAFAAPDQQRFRSTMALAIAAWRHAGDENRARTLEGLAAERMANADARATDSPS